ncbi:MAG: BlaI/MecI/CopY family transcriptional regulator [Ruminococcaceae bacterium]|nr:BlaI/MecI/CopY family transcriptional regulator [Oscillospiraceae bacterium]
MNDKLADSELEIMRVLWDTKRPMKASEITKMLQKTKNWSKATVHVLLGRLENKGFVSADRSGYYHYFSAAIAENEYLCSESYRMVKKVGGSLHSMLASLIETDELSDEDIIAISDMLNEKRKEIEK